MTLLILIVVFVVALCCAAGWLAFGLAWHGQRQVAELERDPSAALDALFDGGRQVVYAPGLVSGGLTTATLVREAGERGYRLVGEMGRMATRSVVFEKVDQ